VLLWLAKPFMGLKCVSVLRANGVEISSPLTAGGLGYVDIGSPPRPRNGGRPTEPFVAADDL
jgi:hypothetical protein